MSLTYRTHIAGMVWSKKIRYETYAISKLRPTPNKSKRVQCIETKEVFNSLREASEKMKISQGAISVNIKHEDGSKVKGYSFKYILP